MSLDQSRSVLYAEEDAEHFLCDCLTGRVGPTALTPQPGNMLLVEMHGLHMPHLLGLTLRLLLERGVAQRWIYDRTRTRGQLDRPGLRGYADLLGHHHAIAHSKCNVDHLHQIILLNGDMPVVMWEVTRHGVDVRSGEPAESALNSAVDRFGGLWAWIEAHARDPMVAEVAMALCPHEHHDPAWHLP